MGLAADCAAGWDARGVYASTGSRRVGLPAAGADRDSVQSPLSRILLCALLCSTLAAAARAGDTLAAIRERGFFTFGADQEGGGPYVYQDPESR